MLNPLRAFENRGATPIFDALDCLRADLSRVSAFTLRLFFCTIQRFFSIQGPATVFFLCFWRNAALSVILLTGGPSCLFELERLDVSSSNKIMLMSSSLLHAADLMTLKSLLVRKFERARCVR